MSRTKPTISGIDKRCYTLAARYLADVWMNDENDRIDLGKRIQRVCERYCREVEDGRR